jgi:YebC/PmpR family DNA-binding regulatory protein
MGAQWKTKIKGENAASKGKIFTKLSKEIMVAARAGADPDMNHRLRAAIDAAKKHSMPRDTIERVVKKGAGLLDEVVHYELVTYEGFAPHQVPIIVECLTDNKNRSAMSMRVLFRKGLLGNSGSVSWDFDHLGIIEATPNSADLDAEAAAIEAGADDLEAGDDGTTIFYTGLTDVDAVARALPAQGFTVNSFKLGYRPKNPVKISDETALAEVEAFLEAVDADDDVQNVYVALAG